MKATLWEVHISQVKKSGTLHCEVVKAPVLWQNRGLTTFMTTTGFGAHGDSRDESSKEQLFRNKKCQIAAGNIRKKFRQLFGS